MEDPVSEGDSGSVDGDYLSPLRPTKYEHEHISRLQVFSDDLQKAIQTSFPRAAHPYVAVTVLLLRWTDDDLDIQTELDRLREVFEFQFRFATEQWNIPSNNSTRALQAKLYDFQEAHQSESELLIVYYGGHGEASRRGKSVWAATRRPDSPTLAWSSLQHLLENAVPHVLIILDCCFAANAARDTAEGSMKELLAACGRENPTTGVGHRSFTSALIEELHSFGSDPFTTAMLHSRLVTIRWRLRYTPIYALLSEHGGNSIHLAPLPAPKVLESHASLQDHGDYTLGDDPMDLSSNDQSPFSTSAQQSSRSSLNAGCATRVLLAVSIEHDAAHDVSQWVTWLTTQAPWDVTQVEVIVEGAYKSHSTLVIVSMPVHAWDGLPDKEAYRFIDFVKSANLQQPRNSSGLASRALGATNPFRRPNLSPRDLASRYGPTENLELLAEESNIELQKGYQYTTRQAKLETAVMKADTEGDLKDGGAMTASLANVYSNAEVEKKSYDALQAYPTPAYPTHNRYLDGFQALLGNSTGDTASTDGKSIQSKPRSPTHLDMWIAKSGLSRLVTNHSAGRSIAEGDAQSMTRRSQPYPRSSTLATMTLPPSESNRSGGPWSAQDDEQLMQARKRGMNWLPLARDYFPNKSANACRKRYERLMDKISASDEWAPSKLEEMAKLYLDLREQMWRLVAKRLGRNWKTVEAKCMEKGVKTLQSTGRRRKTTTIIEESSKHSCFDDNSSDDSSFDDSSSDDNLFDNDWSDDSSLGPDIDREGQSKSKPERLPVPPFPNVPYLEAQHFP